MFWTILICILYYKPARLHYFLTDITSLWHKAEHNSLLTLSNNRTCLIKTEYNFFGPSLSHIYIQAHLTNHNDLTWKYLPGAYFCQGRRSRGVCVVVVVGRTFFPPFKTNDCAFFSSLTKNYRFKVFLEFFGRLSFV